MKRTVALIFCVGCLAPPPSGNFCARDAECRTHELCVGSTCVAKDETLPSVTVISPNDGATIAGRVELTGTASDESGIAAVLVRVDDGEPQTASGTGYWTLVLDTLGLADGRHTLRVVATDLTGNASEPVSRSVLVENVPRSCKHLRAMRPTAQSGVFDLDPDGAGPLPATRAYCDMTTDGGGWTLCYTERDAIVHLSSEHGSVLPFGTPGYRADCRHIPFREVLYVNHDSNERAWFTREAPEELTIAKLGYAADGAQAGLFQGQGVASTAWKYQLNVCDNVWMSVGLMISGWADCAKACGSWCNDVTTEYYRTDGDDGAGYNGVSFKENGHGNVSVKTLSVGIR